MLNRYLCCSIEGIEPRMAVPVFDSVDYYLKRVNIKSSNIIRHLLMFNTAITLASIHNNCSVRDFNRVLFDRMEGQFVREFRKKL